MRKKNIVMSAILSVISFSLSAFLFVGAAKEGMINPKASAVAYQDLDIPAACELNPASGDLFDYSLGYGDVFAGQFTQFSKISDDNVLYSGENVSDSINACWKWQWKSGVSTDTILKLSFKDNCKFTINNQEFSDQWATGSKFVTALSNSKGVFKLNEKQVTEGTIAEGYYGGTYYAKAGDVAYLYMDSQYDGQVASIWGHIIANKSEFDANEYGKQIKSQTSYADVVRQMYSGTNNKTSIGGLNYELLYGDIDGTLNDYQKVAGLEYTLFTGNGTADEQGTMAWDFQIRNGCGSENTVLKMTASDNTKLTFEGHGTSGWATAIYRLVLEHDSVKREVKNEELIANGAADIASTVYLKNGDSLYFVADAADEALWQTNNFAADISYNSEMDEAAYANQFPAPETATLGNIISGMISSNSNVSYAVNGLETSLLYGDVDGELSPMLSAGEVLTANGSADEQGNMAWSFQWRGGAGTENLVLKMEAKKDLVLSSSLTSSTSWANVFYRVILENESDRYEKAKIACNASNAANIGFNYHLKNGDVVYVALDADPGTLWQTVGFDGSISTSNAFDESSYAAQFGKTITWVIDGVESSEVVSIGEIPTHETPTKESTAQYDYTFKEWTPEVVAVVDDATYTATWNEILRKYTVTFSAVNGSLGQSKVENVPYGSSIAVENNVLTINGTNYTAVPSDGYKFVSFDVTNTTLTGDLTITASFTEKDNIKYTVNHYQQNLNDNQYTLVDSDELYGMYNQPTAAVAKEYTGFDALTINQGVIAADGSTVIEVKYDRKLFTVTWKNGNDQVIETDSNVKYGATPTYDGLNPIKSNDEVYSYTFNGTWLPAIGQVSQDVTYVAQFDSARIPLNSISFADIVRSYNNNNKVVYAMNNIVIDLYFGDFDNDILYEYYTHSGSEVLTGLDNTDEQSNMLWPWQFRAGDGEQNAIIKITADSDCKVVFAGSSSTDWAQALYRFVLVSGNQKYELKNLLLNKDIASVNLAGEFYLKANDELYFVMDEPDGVMWQTCQIDGSISTNGSYSQSEYETQLASAIVPEVSKDISYFGIVKEVFSNQGKYETDLYDVNLYAGDVVRHLYEANIFATYQDIDFVAFIKDGQEKEGNPIEQYPVVFYDWQFKSGSQSLKAIVGFTAKENINIRVSTKATIDKNASGELEDWSSNAGANFTYFIKTIDGDVVKVYAKDVVKVANEDEYSFTANIKEGESFYFTYAANWGVIVQNPTFTIDDEQYDPDWKYTVVKKEFDSVVYSDMLSEYVDNGLKDVVMDSISYGFGYGSIDDIQKFAYHLGDGSGMPEDSIGDVDRTLPDEQTSNSFWRWQVRCCGEADSFIYIKALENTFIELKHDTIELAYLSNMFISVYVVNEDGIQIQLSSMPMDLVCEPNQYFDSVHLKKGDTLYIVFSFPNGGTYTSTSAFNCSVKSIPASYDESLRADFGAQERLNALIEEKVNAITAKVNSLNILDYSDVKWVEIEDIALVYKQKIQSCTTVDEVNEKYAEAISKIDAVEKKEEEAADLSSLKQSKIEYIQGLFNAKEYSKKDAKEIEGLLATAIDKINGAKTEAAINTIVAQFTNQLEQFSKKKSGCKGSFAGGFELIGLLGALIVLKKRK